MGWWKVLETGPPTEMPRKGEAGQQRRMSPTPEPRVWSLEELEKNSIGEKWVIIGNMGVYVGDLLLGPDNILEEALTALEEKFTLAKPEWVTMDFSTFSRSCMFLLLTLSLL